MINFNKTFNVEALTRLSTTDCAVAILENTANGEIFQSELVTLVAEKKGISKGSVNGTLWGGNITPRPHKLKGRVEFKQHWYSSKLPNGRNVFIKIGKQVHFDETIAYDTVNKQFARSRGAEKYLKLCKKKNPIILTMASEHGYDVIQFKKINPNCIIHNVESNRVVLDKVEGLQLPMSSYFGDISNCVSNYPDRYFDIINYDTDGYVSANLHKTLQIINDRCSTKYLCLTIQNLKRFRNHGKFATKCRSEYDCYENPTMAYLELGPMTNYDIIDTFVYNRSNDGAKCVDMRMVIFKLIPYSSTKIKADGLFTF